MSHSGAEAGDVLFGTSPSNAGLRIRLAQAQPPGSWGPVGGRFEILDAGSNMHSPVLERLVGQPTDAAQVLKLIRRQHPACVNVVNANILSRHEPGPAPSPGANGQAHGDRGDSEVASAALAGTPLAP